MSKLIPMDQAARILGMTVDQLTELRSNNEIFGYRDGANWKFKKSELERVAGELGIEANFSAAESADDGSEDFGFNLEDSGKNLVSDDNPSSGAIIEDLDSSEYIEDSSVEIVQKDDVPAADDDAIDLADSGLLSGANDDSEALLLDESGDLFGSSENVLDGSDKLSFGSSSLSLASESSKKLGKDPANLLDDEPESKGSPSDTGKMVGEGGDGGDDLLLSEDDLFSDELSLADSASFEDSAELSSDFEDSDLVLEDSDSNTEVKLEANNSGINLSPNDSGIVLDDQPLELGGSDIDALELPEDDEMIVLEDAADSDAQTLMQEDDFNLTPLEAEVDDESSGSQVIALEDSEIYADDSAATILGASDEFSQPAMLDDGGFAEDLAYPGAAAGAAGMAVGPAQLPEAPYTVAQVISLGLVTFLLATGGMVAYNLAQNMWIPTEQPVGSSVLSFFLNMTGN